MNQEIHSSMIPNVQVNLIFLANVMIEFVNFKPRELNLIGGIVLAEFE
jgi:hypothetical protein